MVLATRLNRLPAVGPFGFGSRDVDAAFNQLLNGSGHRPESFPVDIRENENRFYVEADLPGFKKEEIEITLEDQTLTILAERKTDQQEAGKGEVLISERRNHKFARTFKLPPIVDGQTVNAKLQDGVLFVTLTKREESKPMKITVS